MTSFIYITDRPSSPEVLSDTFKIVDLAPSAAGTAQTIAAVWERKVAQRIVAALNLFAGQFPEDQEETARW